MALIIVNSLTDTVDASDGVTTLREALVLANADPGADRIEFAEAGTVALGGASLVLSSDVVIDGDTDGDGEADITITGRSGARVVSILSGTATLENLTLTRGGGIVHVAEGADATISNSTLSQGRAREGGGVLNQGTLTVLDSVITGNSAYFGGGIYSLGDSVTTIERSAIVGNMAGPTSPPVGAYGGGIAAEGRSLVTIRSSTIAGNTIVDGDSGGIYIGSNASVIATNATVTGNGQAGIVSRGNLDLTNSIVLGNQGGDVVFGGEAAPSAITFVNSLVSGGPLAVFAKIDPATGGGVAEDNGGAVPTVALRNDPANPALDAGIDRLAPLTDARGVPARFNVPGALNNGTNTSDLGAFELRTATSGDDPLFGTPGDDTLDGLAGDDTVSGRGGDDLITGGRGDDTLLGDGGDDTLLGDAGADRLDGGAGRDTARYGAVSVRYIDHYITLPNGTRFPVYGTRDEGHIIDLLDPTRNTNDAMGDTFFSVEIIEGGELADRFYGTGASVDFLCGGGGGDTLVGRGQSDYLDGGDASDLLIGGRGNDVLTGGAGSDYIRGDAGIDRVTFGTAVTVDLADVAANTGEAAGDRYFDIENIDGSHDADDLRGDGQANEIRGRDGDDTLAGRGGDDVLEGGRGADTLTGGAGADMFLFTGVNQGGDTITDFEAGVDRLAFASAGFGGLPTDTLAEPRFVAGPLPLNANDRFMYDQETGALYYDADGRFAGEAKLMAVLDGAPALDFADIVIV